MKLEVDAVTNANARALLERGVEAIQAGDLTVDLGNVSTVDSAAVALLLAWQRAATALGKRLVFKNVPPGIVSLATLYGVDSLLQIEPASA